MFFVWAMFRFWCLHLFIRIVVILFSVAGFMFVILSVAYPRCFRSIVFESFTTVRFVFEARASVDDCSIVDQT